MPQKQKMGKDNKTRFILSYVAILLPDEIPPPPESKNSEPIFDEISKSTVSEINVLLHNIDEDEFVEKYFNFNTIFHGLAGWRHIPEQGRQYLQKLLEYLSGWEDDVYPVWNTLRGCVYLPANIIAIPFTGLFNAARFLFVCLPTFLYACYIDSDKDNSSSTYGDLIPSLSSETLQGENTNTASTSAENLGEMNSSPSHSTQTDSSSGREIEYEEQLDLDDHHGVLAYEQDESDIEDEAIQSADEYDSANEALKKTIRDYTPGKLRF